jgi:glycosyltransferase involved in cell wall biosynthesis
MGIVDSSASGRLRIGVVNTSTGGGGAARIAVSLASQQHLEGNEVIVFSRDGVGRISGEGVSIASPSPRSGRFSELIRLGKNPRALFAKFRGNEDFEYPLIPAEIGNWGPFDLLHLHNLHGGFFDLRQLPYLSSLQPTVITLHDMWLLTGHCAHSFSCSRWRTGCGKCPDLSIYPSLWRDGTKENWQRKKEIVRNSRIEIVTPSAWLRDQARMSPLFHHLREQIRVIPNGVDLTEFFPMERSIARREVGLSDDCIVIGLAAVGIVQNPFKDFATACATLATYVGRHKHRGQRVIALVFGAEENELPRGLGVEFVSWAERSSRRYFYACCNAFLHAAKAENAPLVVLEAIASNRPVVASAVGGIPEILGKFPRHGYLTPAGDVEAMAAALEEAVSTPDLMPAENFEFSLSAMSTRYRELYSKIRNDFLVEN